MRIFWKAGAWAQEKWIFGGRFTTGPPSPSLLVSPLVPLQSHVSPCGFYSRLSSREWSFKAASAPEISEVASALFSSLCIEIYV